MKAFSYQRPATAAEAVQMHATAGADARFIAGGTTLYDLMKLNVERPQHLIDVTTIRGLDMIDTAGLGALRFGALAPMSAVAADATVQRDYPVLAEALLKAASQQLRNMATVGGKPAAAHPLHLLPQRRRQRIRRRRLPVQQARARQRLRGARRAGPRPGGAGPEQRLHRGEPGDWPVALVALDARVTLHGLAAPARCRWPICTGCPAARRTSNSRCNRVSW